MAMMLRLDSLFVVVAKPPRLACARRRSKTEAAVIRCYGWLTSKQRLMVFFIRD